MDDLLQVLPRHVEHHVGAMIVREELSQLHQRHRAHVRQMRPLPVQAALLRQILLQAKLPPVRLHPRVPAQLTHVDKELSAAEEAGRPHRHHLTLRPGRRCRVCGAARGGAAGAVNSVIR